MRAHYGDVNHEYTSLREGCALVDYEGAGLARVSGPGATDFLGMHTSRNVEFLFEGQISTAWLLRPDGTVIAEVLVYCREDDYLLEVWPAQATAALTHLTGASAEFDGVDVEDVGAELRVFGVEGPESFRIAQKFLDFPISSLAYSSFTTLTWEGTHTLLTRSGVTGEYGYKLYVSAESAAAMHEVLTSLGAVPCGTDALDICRMEMRFANVEGEGGGGPVTPFDLNAQWMVDFAHDFTGKDALTAQWDDGQPQRPVCWMASEDTAGTDRTPDHGTPLSVDGSAVGAVAFAVHSPTLGRVIGTAQVNREVAASGLEFTVGDGVPARSVSAPFLVPKSFSVAMD